MPPKAAFIFYHNIFAENTSQAQPASYAARRASWFCTAKLHHCPTGVFYHFVTNKTFLTPKNLQTARTFYFPQHLLASDLYRAIMGFVALWVNTI
jgi:hypothetical protein